MSDDEEKPEWREVELNPYEGITESLKNIRDKVAKLRDELEKEIEEKEDS